MNQITVTVDLDELQKLVKKAGMLVWKRDAEKSLLELMNLYEEIGHKIEEIKKAIETAGLAVHPGFKGVIGKDIKVIYRIYGEKYTFDKSNLPDDQFLKTFSYQKVNSKAVDSFIEEHNMLPENVYEKDRKPTISLIKIKDDKAKIESQSALSLDAGEN